MYFSVPRSDDLYQIKVKLVGPNERRYQIPFEHKERVTRKCLTFLRIVVATREELEPLIKATSLIKIDPISIRNEAAAMRLVAKEAENVLNGFDTSLEEDNKLLASENLTMNIRNCVLMRRGEKEILHAYIDLAERINQVEHYDLKTLEEYLQAEVYGKGPKASIEWRREMYFRELWIPLLTGVKLELEEMNNSLGE